MNLKDYAITELGLIALFALAGVVAAIAGGVALLSWVAKNL